MMTHINENISINRNIMICIHRNISMNINMETNANVYVKGGDTYKVKQENKEKYDDTKYIYIYRKQEGDGKRNIKRKIN